MLDDQVEQAVQVLAGAFGLERWGERETRIAWSVLQWFGHYIWAHIYLPQSAGEDMVVELDEERPVMRIDEAEIYTLLSDPPRYLVFAKGTANVNATNARLVPQPATLDQLVFEMVADHGPMPVLTEVEASYIVDHLPGPVTVRGATNEVVAKEVHGD